jgi:hypothetical protein
VQALKVRIKSLEALLEDNGKSVPADTDCSDDEGTENDDEDGEVAVATQTMRHVHVRRESWGL